jgi:hypothetical protein
MAAVFGKKGDGEPADGDAAASGGQGDLRKLSDSLAELGGMFEQANRQMVEYLLARETPAAEAESASSSPPQPSETSDLAEAIAALGKKIDRLGSAAAESGERAPAAQISPEAIAESLRPISEKLDVLDQQNTALYPTMEQLQSRVDGGVQSLAELLVPPAQEEEEPSAISGDWLTAVLGSELAGDRALGVSCQQLLEGVLAGDGGAAALAGQLLVFRSATPERLPQLLKDVGEAYYRWQPKTAPGNNLFEEALVAYLQCACENSSIYNSIELVHPGERFDSGRHNASSRGVEIVQVLGWIVLRDNGKVYTKAAVEVR